MSHFQRSFLFLFFALSGMVSVRAQQPVSSAPPPLSFVDMIGDTVNYTAAIHDQPLVLLYFHPDCPECVQTIRELKHYEDAYPAPIWLISRAPLSQLRVFESMLELYAAKNLRVLQDYSGVMHLRFDFKWLPYIVLLDRNGHPVETFAQLPTPETVSRLLKP